MATDDRLIVLPDELSDAEKQQAGIYLGDPQYKVRDFVNEVMARRGEAFQALTDEFQALMTGLCDQFAMMRKHDPDFDLSKITFERPRWLNDGGTFVFDISYDGKRLLPRNVRWE